MKKTGILLIAASMLLTSCGINVPDEKSNDNSEQNTSSETESKTSESSSKPGKYDDYKNCEWFSIGLEKYTDANGNNTYFNGLVVYETLAKGVYTKGEEYKVFVCDNGDAVFVETRGTYRNEIDAFDKSEYNHTEINLDYMSYTDSDFRKTRNDQIYYFYFDLAIQFYATYFDSYTYENTKYNSMGDVFSFLGFNIRDKSVGTVEASDNASIICTGVVGEATTYDESYILSTYMNHDSSFKCAGLPPFLSENNLVGWSYTRGVSTKQDYRIWTDDQLQTTFYGYTIEDIRSWIPLFTSAGYEMTSTSGSLDDGSTDYTYKASRPILKVTITQEKSGGTTSVKEHYYKTNIELHFFVAKYDNNYNPEILGVIFRINFPNPVVYDPGGTLVAEDNGLFLYYKNAGVSEKTKIVNKSGQIENSSIINDKLTIKFDWPNA